MRLNSNKRIDRIFYFLTVFLAFTLKVQGELSHLPDMKEPPNNENGEYFSSILTEGQKHGINRLRIERNYFKLSGFDFTLPKNNLVNCSGIMNFKKTDEEKMRKLHIFSCRGFCNVIIKAYLLNDTVEKFHDMGDFEGLHVALNVYCMKVKHIPEEYEPMHFKRNFTLTVDESDKNKTFSNMNTFETERGSNNCSLPNCCFLVTDLEKPSNIEVEINHRVYSLNSDLLFTKTEVELVSPEILFQFLTKPLEFSPYNLTECDGSFHGIQGISLSPSAFKCNGDGCNFLKTFHLEATDAKVFEGQKDGFSMGNFVFKCKVLNKITSNHTYFSRNLVFREKRLKPEDIAIDTESLFINDLFIPISSKHDLFFKPVPLEVTRTLKIGLNIKKFEHFGLKLYSGNGTLQFFGSIVENLFFDCTSETCDLPFSIDLKNIVTPESSSALSLNRESLTLTLYFTFYSGFTQYITKKYIVHFFLIPSPQYLKNLKDLDKIQIDFLHSSHTLYSGLSFTEEIVEFVSPHTHFQIVNPLEVKHFNLTECQGTLSLAEGVVSTLTEFKCTGEECHRVHPVHFRAFEDLSMRDPQQRFIIGTFHLQCQAANQVTQTQIYFSKSFILKEKRLTSGDIGISVSQIRVNDVSLNLSSNSNSISQLINLEVSTSRLTIQFNPTYHEHFGCKLSSGNGTLELPGFIIKEPSFSCSAKSCYFPYSIPLQGLNTFGATLRFHNLKASLTLYFNFYSGLTQLITKKYVVRFLLNPPPPASA